MAVPPLLELLIVLADELYIYAVPHGSIKVEASDVQLPSGFET